MKFERTAVLCQGTQWMSRKSHRVKPHDKDLITRCIACNSGDAADAGAWEKALPLG
jgi:hypothetical protein